MNRDIRVQGPSGTRLSIPMVPVDAVGLVERASFFTKRSLKGASKLDGLYLAIQLIDLTTLEGADTPGRVIQLCNKAKFPLAPRILSELEAQYGVKVRPIPPVAAVCVYPSLVPVAVEQLKGTSIGVASVATAFPSGQAQLASKLPDVKEAVKAGASEIDMVISRRDYLSGNYQKVFDEIVAVKDICGDSAHLKVILETGELAEFDHVALASRLAIAAGADFIKTSTGKAPVNATLPVSLLMMQIVRDHQIETGEWVGFKPAGGIRTAKEALAYLCLVKEELGTDWLRPDRFRFGASALLNDLLRQILKQATGRYFHSTAYSLD